MSHLAVAILAAGNSSRMNGQSKQLLDFGGETLLERTINCFKGLDVHVFLGSQFDQHAKVIQRMDIKIHQVKNWQLGMGATIKSAIKCLSGHQAILLSACDQPFLSNQIVKEFLQVNNQKADKLVISDYGQAKGIPILVPKKYYSDFLSIPDQNGGKSVISKYSDEFEIVFFSRGEIDIDTEEIYQQTVTELVN
ncbi:nucleotidyltransferase family protein [Reichenbachiella versicolor]|uniref:nucleotidyltransferase family protein n=1 Tax=Reichenbachiella versicolor TaxID=1821036 RepID=UPI0013A58BFF|nr:nucleotidyltransferase family protein [Reichenbachiella versicolor]